MNFFLFVVELRGQSRQAILDRHKCIVDQFCNALKLGECLYLVTAIHITIVRTVNLPLRGCPKGRSPPVCGQINYTPFC